MYFLETQNNYRLGFTCFGVLVEPFMIEWWGLGSISFPWSCWRSHGILHPMSQFRPFFSGKHQSSQVRSNLGASDAQLWIELDGETNGDSWFFSEIAIILEICALLCGFLPSLCRRWRKEQDNLLRNTRFWSSRERKTERE